MHSHRIKNGILTALCLFLLGAPAAFADVITGVTVTTTVGTCCGNPPVSRIVDGSGLTSYDPTATALAAPDTYWGGTSGNGRLDFDLHGTYNVSDIVIWNGDPGIKDINLEYSTDGSTYLAIPGFPVILNRSDLFPNSFPPQRVSFAPVLATNIRMTVLDSYNNNMEIREVMFLSATEAAVPEPGSLALLGSLLGGLWSVGKLRRSRRKACL